MGKKNLASAFVSGTLAILAVGNAFGATANKQITPEQAAQETLGRVIPEGQKIIHVACMEASIKAYMSKDYWALVGPNFFTAGHGYNPQTIDIQFGIGHKSIKNLSPEVKAAIKEAITQTTERFELNQPLPRGHIFDGECRLRDANTRKPAPH